jgi:putative endonuclease
MSQTRQTIGRWGESTAADFITQKGYIILGRNIRTPYGEIDLVAQKEGCTVFVEVKTRTTKLFGAPEVAVSKRKQDHMTASAEYYFQNHPDMSGEWRIDVISIETDRRGSSPVITHFENAI